MLRTRDVSGLSIWMWLINIVGAFCWAAHGFVIGDPALLYTDCIVFLLDLIVLVCMFRYGRPFAGAGLSKAIPTSDRARGTRIAAGKAPTSIFKSMAGTR